MMDASHNRHDDLPPISHANAEAIELWNTILFDKFQKFRPFVTEALATHGRALMTECRLREGHNVVDIGCGFGDSTVDLARVVGPTGVAIGVDAAPRFIAEARRLAAASGVANARFAVADAQTDALGFGFDLAYSRFGTMFFASPVLALRNIARSLRADGQLAMVVWRTKRDNEFVNVVEQAVEAVLGRPRADSGPTCGPGPFSMANPDNLRVILAAAGFATPSIERFDAELRLGSTIAEAMQLTLALGPAGELIRLAGDIAPEKQAACLEAAAGALKPFARPDGVFAGSSTWLVTARANT